MNATNYGQQPGEDEKRLKELRSYDVLDTVSEKEYDDIAKLASIICDVPIALVSIVDKERQWFKANVGLPVAETHRQHSFCSHAILTPNEPFVIEDSRLDERFKNNPYVTGNPDIIFYAGIPLVSKNGYGLGSFCVIDNKPRTLTDAQMEGLKILAGQVMNLLELRRANMDLKLKQEYLEVKNKNLDTIIADRIAEIAEQNSELERANKELQAFNYISSHDLQEPLRKIQIFSSLISERELDNLSESGKNYFARIGQASSRMSHLIKDLLAFSRSTTGRGRYETVSFAKISEDVIADLHDDIEQKQALVSITGDGGFKAISFQLRQAIYNLVSNALKFSRPDVPPVIAISYTANTVYIGTGKKAKETLSHVITVADNGIGFDSRYNDKIFELFQRLETKDKQIGTGIGLAIVKKIAENHKGNVSVSSIPNQGTTFTITLPTH